MAETGSFRKTPVIDLSDKVVAKGTTTSSSINYDYGILNSTSLRLYTAITISGDTEETHESTNYSTNVKIKIVITYWNDDGTSKGSKQCISAYPYSSYETIKARSSMDIDLEDDYVKNVTLTLYYTGSNDSATFATVLLKASATTNEVLNEAYSTSVGLDSFDTYINGCKLYYTGDTDNPLSLKFSADDNGKLAAIVITDSTGDVIKTVTRTMYNTLMP